MSRLAAESSPNRCAVAVALAMIALTVRMAFAWSGLDYIPVVGADNPAPSITAIAQGHWTLASHVMPAMGLVSIVLRLPLAVLAGGDLWWGGRLGAVACLLPLTVLAWHLDRRSIAAGSTPLIRTVRAVALIAGPGISFAVHVGHPEEVLVGVLCVFAVLAALSERRLAAAILLGLAVGTKQGAIVAAVPVLLAVGGPSLLDRRRIVAGVIAAAVAAACIAPVVALDPHRYQESAKTLAGTRGVYPSSMWWPVSPSFVRQIPMGADAPILVKTSRLPLGLHRGAATSVALLLSFALLLIAAVRRGQVDPLAILVLVMGLRCMFDPWNIDYYVAPALIAVAAWEGMRAPGVLPLWTLSLSALTFFAYRVHDHGVPAQWFMGWLLATTPLLLLGFVPRLEAWWRARTEATSAAAPGPLAGSR